MTKSSRTKRTLLSTLQNDVSGNDLLEANGPPPVPRQSCLSANRLNCRPWEFADLFVATRLAANSNRIGKALTRGHIEVLEPSRGDFSSGKDENLTVIV
jgi:hypothetical protein